MIRICLAFCLFLSGCAAQFGVQPLQSKNFSKEEVAAAFKARDEQLKVVANAVVELGKKLDVLEKAKK